MRVEAAALARLIEAAAPSAAALDDGRRVVRYADLRLRISHLAGRLAATAGLDDGPVVIASRNPLRRALTVWLGAASGRDVAILDPGRGDLDRVLRSIAPALVLAEQGDVSGPWVTLPCAWLDDPIEVDRADDVAQTANQAGWLVASSGTEGPARIARLSQAAILAHARASNAATGLGPGDVWLTPISLQHIGGLAVLSRCALAGACALLHEFFEPHRVVDAVMAGEVSHLSLVPAMLDRVLDCADGRAPPRRLRCVLIGGATLHPAIAERARTAGWPLWVAYGMTETGSHVTFEAVAEGWEAGRVGRPLQGVRIAIDQTAGVAFAGSGPIRIEGPVVMDGYLQASGAVANIGGVFVSGDLGRMDDQGNLHLLGRADDVLISGGVNLHPASVERLLGQCPGVADVAVTAVDDPRWGDLLVAIFCGDVDETAVEQWCREYLQSAQRPRRFLRLPALPRNSGGKLEREILRRLARDG
jgi:O-succinylbenzoic acid--CoA ligase